MKDDDGLPTTTANMKKENSDSGLLFGKGRYKFWALAAILLLAFWSMLTGTVTLRWSAGNLNRLSDDLDISIHDDLDVLVSSFLPLFYLYNFVIYVIVFFWSWILDGIKCVHWVGFWGFWFDFGFGNFGCLGNGGEGEGGEAHVGYLH